MNTQNSAIISAETTIVCCALLVAVGICVLVPTFAYWFIGALGVVFAYRRGKRTTWGHTDNALIAASVAVLMAYLLLLSVNKSHGGNRVDAPPSVSRSLTQP